jgi:hypothetical protein
MNKNFPLSRLFSRSRFFFFFFFFCVRMCDANQFINVSTFFLKFYSLSLSLVFLSKIRPHKICFSSSLSSSSRVLCWFLKETRGKEEEEDKEEEDKERDYGGIHLAFWEQ